MVSLSQVAAQGTKTYIAADVSSFKYMLAGFGKGFVKALEKAFPRLWKRSVDKLEDGKEIERVGARV